MNETIAYLGLLADEDIELDSAALMLSALDHDGIDVEPYLVLLRAIGSAIDTQRSAIGDRDLQSGEAQGALLAHIISGQFGFVGDSDSYDAPLNADMVRVLDRRLGLPVSLSILYVAAARRAGWRCHALNTPGHVLVSIGPEDAPAIIDPFRSGVLVQAEQLTELLTRAAASGLQAQSVGEPMSNRTTLVRLLLNQATRAEDAGDSWRACTIYERMTVVAPEHDASWWALARLQLVLGEVEAARASLCAMLEISRDPERRRYVAAALSQLSGQSQA
ncbi:MAG TPA: transglutaminase-like domain-containing protein [Sphingobium sp.]|nr:transglutaminase-like domain-containing protein [Sphingobium sp.]